MISEKLIKLKSKFNHYAIDGYVVPKNDEFFSEFAQKDKLKAITGFDGSFGLAIILFFEYSRMASGFTSGTIRGTLGSYL